MRRVIYAVLLVLINIVLYGSLKMYISINNITPNLLLITTVSVALLRGKYAGGIIGFFCGLLQDMTFGQVLGFYALIYMYLGFFSGYLYRIIYKDSVLIPTIVIAISDLIFGLYVYIFTFLLRGKLNMGHYFLNIIIPEVVYTALIAVLIYKFYHYMNMRLTRDGEKEAGTN
ncbi:rod shape-determining protein MreD [Vallitalea pronyensis]|uniref:Rod shape-determining protein MreD n=1 Tax=Vallitalea pronyensis TaxID=1348613 RepID=A0A8J8MKR1_9FIRM|nr:rod shape-determining protein MreD [Vallitalea pronyensis]QUI23334.1 rod shape-determining protein MreD [Vallitalea pronyensis]